MGRSERRRRDPAVQPSRDARSIGLPHLVRACAGTIPISNMRIDPDGIAQRLMSLHGSVRG